MNRYNSKYCVYSADKIYVLNIVTNGEDVIKMHLMCEVRNMVHCFISDIQVFSDERNILILLSKAIYPTQKSALIALKAGEYI